MLRLEASTGWNGRGEGVSKWKCSIYGRGGALMWRSEGRPLVALGSGVNMWKREHRDGSPDTEELVAL